MEAPLEIRYAGVVIGRAQEVQMAEGDALSFFIPVRDPMPVGTVLRMRSGDQETPVRVVRAIEAADAAVCGIQVKNIGETEEVALEFIPPPATAGEKVKAGTPTPAVEVDVATMRSESTAAEVATLELESSPAPSALAAPTQAPAVEAAEEPQVAFAPGPAGEVAAVPEAVPVAVASSMTGALRNATESVSLSMPTSESPTTPNVQASEPASPKPDSASARNATLAYGSVAVPQAKAQSEDGSAATATRQPTGEDLPPARPISGPNGRRKTKRRK